LTGPVALAAIALFSGLDAAEIASVARACRTTLELSLVRALERSSAHQVTVK
jgi:hypothetical protein